MNLITKKIHLLGLLLVLHSSYALSMGSNGTTIDSNKNQNQGITTNTSSTNGTQKKSIASELTVESDIPKEENNSLNKWAETTTKTNITKNKSENHSDTEDSLNEDDSSDSAQVQFLNVPFNSQPYGDNDKQSFLYTKNTSSEADNYIHSTIQNIQSNINHLYYKMAHLQNTVNNLNKKDNEENTVGSITQGGAEAFGDNCIIATVNYSVTYNSNNQTVVLTKQENQRNSVYTRPEIIVKDISKDFGKDLLAHTQNQAAINNYRNNQQFYTNAATMCKSIFYAATILTAGAIGGSVDYSKIQNAQFELKDVKPKLFLVGGLMGLTGVSWFGSKLCSKKAIKIGSLIKETELIDEKVFKNISKNIHMSEE